MGKRATKTWNLFCKLLLNELNSDVTRFSTHVQTCFATNKIAASCLNTDFWLDKITRRDLRHLLQNKYCLGPLKLSNIADFGSKSRTTPLLCNNFSQPATTWFVAWRVLMWVVKRATSLVNSFLTRFFCPFYRAFTGTLLGCFSSRTGTSVDDGKERGEY